MQDTNVFENMYPSSDRASLIYQELQKY